MKNEQSEVIEIFDEEGKTLEKIIEELFYDYLNRELKIYE